MIQACRREIEEFHVFFQEWFEATVPDDDVTFARVAEALAEDFELISPDGRRRDRDTILASIRDGYGDHAGGGRSSGSRSTTSVTGSSSTTARSSPMKSGRSPTGRRTDG